MRETKIEVWKRKVRNAKLKAERKLVWEKLKEVPTQTVTTPFGKVVIPLIRKIMPNMIASQLVGVQPMGGAEGLFDYGTDAKNARFDMEGLASILSLKYRYGAEDKGILDDGYDGTGRGDNVSFDKWEKP